MNIYRCRIGSHVDHNPSRATAAQMPRGIRIVIRPTCRTDPIEELGAINLPQIARAAGE
jgi:hypothetical protein